MPSCLIRVGQHSGTAAPDAAYSFYHARICLMLVDVSCLKSASMILGPSVPCLSATIVADKAPCSSA